MKNEILKEWCVVIAIAAFAAILYAHTLGFGFTWDDVRFIVRGPYIKSPACVPSYFITDIWRLSSDPLQSTYYRPFFLLSFFMDYARGGLNPKTFHFTNLILLIFLALIVYAFAKNITNSRKVSVFTAILFTVHPVTAQVVSWISARADLLFLAFVLISFICFIKSGKAASPYLRVPFYLGSVLTFALGLLSKETALFLLPLFIWYDYCLNTDFKPQRLLNNIKDYLPYLILLFFYVWVKHIIAEGADWMNIKTHWALSPGALFALTVKSIPYYVKTAIFSFTNDIQAMRRVTIPGPDLAGKISIIILAGFLIVYFSRYRLSFKKEIFFLGLAAITSFSILFVATLMGSRYLLFPIVGVVGFASLFITRLTDRLSAFRKHAVYGIFWIMIIACAFSSYRITFYWKDDGSLLRFMLARYTNDPDLHESLGCWYSNSNDPAAAIKEYKRALDLDPHLLRSRFNLAHAYYTSDRSDDAISEFGKIAKEDKLMPHVHQALAVIYDQKGDREKAIEEVKYELSLKLPDRLKMLEFLVYLYVKNGETQKAARLWNAIKSGYMKKSSLSSSIML